MSDSVSLGLLLPTQTFMRAGSTLLMYGMLCMGFLLLVPDFVTLDPLLLLQKSLRPGSTSSASGMTRTGSAPLVLDFGHFSLPLLVHGFM